MLPAIINKITAGRTSVQDDLDLVASLETCFSDLVYQGNAVKSWLTQVMGLGNETASANAAAEDNRELTSGMTLGMTYMATALLHCRTTADDNSPEIIVSAVEQGLLSNAHVAYSHLRGHKKALQRFEQLLNGYIDILKRQDNGNYARRLFHLKCAVLAFAPSPEYITVAHPLLVREAAHSGCHESALPVMRQPILMISPEDTGASLKCLHDYYLEGALLLAGIRCWEDATLWSHYALSTFKYVERKPLVESSQWDRVPILRGKETIDNVEKVNDGIVLTTKLFILFSIISRGGIHDPTHRRQIQSVMRQFRLSNIESYIRLLKAASRRDGGQWDAVEKQYASTWADDTMVEYVAEARGRLRHHVICDMARVVDRVYLTDILSTLHQHKLSADSGGGGGSVSEKSAVMQLLMEMHEEGELLISLERVQDVSVEEENEHSDAKREELIAVRLVEPPKRIPLPLGIRRRRGVDAISLSGAGDEWKKRLCQQGELHRAVVERIKRYEWLHAALIRANRKKG